MKDEFEQFKFYRFIKATHYTFLIFLLFVIFGMGFSSKPETIVDNENSYFTCVNGLDHTFASIGALVYSVDATKLGYYDNINAKKVCSANYKNPGGYYYLTVKTEIEGSWIMVIKIWIFGGALIYIILNMIRESFIYIFYGRRFTWSWARNLIIFFENLWSQPKIKEKLYQFAGLTITVIFYLFILWLLIMTGDYLKSLHITSFSDAYSYFIKKIS